MTKLETLIGRIEELRTDLKTVLDTDRELIDPEVIKVSQSLDKALIKYYRTLRVRKSKVLEGGMK